MNITDRLSRANGLLSARIKVFSPMVEGDPYIALIGGLHLPFFGETPMQVTRKADEWRRQEYENLTSRAQRRQDAEALSAAGGAE